MHALNRKGGQGKKLLKQFAFEVHEAAAAEMRKVYVLVLSLTSRPLSFAILTLTRSLSLTRSSRPLSLARVTPSHSLPFDPQASKDDIPMGTTMISDVEVLPDEPETGFEEMSDACDYCGAKKKNIANLKRCATCGCSNAYVSCALLSLIYVSCVLGRDVACIGACFALVAASHACPDFGVQCSQVCQMGDWQTHKKVCKDIIKVVRSCPPALTTPRPHSHPHRHQHRR